MSKYMTSFIKSAKSVHDVESDLSYVEIVYERYVKNKGYATYTDYINTEPLADWTYIESEKHYPLREVPRQYGQEDSRSETTNGRTGSRKHLIVRTI